MARLVDLPLRAKIVLILSGVVLAYGALDALIQRFVVYDSFVRLEERQAPRDAQRVRDAIQNEVRHLELRASDWATADEAGRFVSGQDPDPAHASLDERTLARETGVEFTLAPVLEALARESDRAAFDEATAGDAPVVRLLDGQHLRTLARMTDISEAPGLMIETRSRRAISSSGATALRYALVSTVAAGLLMMLALLFLLTRAVLEPLARLTAHAVEIGRTEELTHRLELQRAD